MSLAYELSVNVFTVITCDLVLKVVLKILYFMVALEFKASFKKEILLYKRVGTELVCTMAFITFTVSGFSFYNRTIFIRLEKEKNTSCYLCTETVYRKEEENRKTFLLGVGYTGQKNRICRFVVLCIPFYIYLSKKLVFFVFSKI